jgi:hypothetical protein
VSSLVVTAGVPAIETVTDPPPAGTVAEPLPDVAPAVTLTRSVAPAQPAGIAPTVTEATFDADRFWSTVSPTLVHRPVVAVPAPMDALANESDAAKAIDAPTTMPTLVAEIAARSQRIAVSAPPVVSLRAYPLMTTLTAVIEAADTAGENVAEKLVPLAGVVPVASPSDALAAPARVTLYGLL